jgi:hypothetical protein
MTREEPRPEPAPELDPEREALRAAVLADPQAVLEDAEIVRALLRAHEGAEAGRKVVDLRGALVARLESRLGRLEETHRSVVAAAYDNLAVTDSIHRAVLAVLDPEDLDGLLEALARRLPTILTVDSVRLCLEADASEQPEAPEPPLVAISPGGVGRYMALDYGEGAEEDAPDRPVVLRATGTEAALIFGADGVTLGSEALVRLDFGEGAPAGMLAFGARDPERFTPDQAGDLLEFLGAVVARASRRWLIP